jgi:amidase
MLAMTDHLMSSRSSALTSSAATLPAVAGYPHLTVPMGLVRGLPVGLSFIGTKGADATVLGAGYAYEKRAHARVAPRYLPRTEGR